MFGNTFAQKKWCRHGYGFVFHGQSIAKCLVLSLVPHWIITICHMPCFQPLVSKWLEWGFRIFLWWPTLLLYNYADHCPYFVSPHLFPLITNCVWPSACSWSHWSSPLKDLSSMLEKHLHWQLLLPKNPKLLITMMTPSKQSNIRVVASCW